MTEVDNPEVGSENPGTEGQDQATNLLDGSTQAADTQVAAPQTDTSWKDALSDDLKSAKSMASINSVEDLAKGFVNAQSVIGRRFEDLTPEQRSQYYSDQGRPQAAEGYELETPEGLQVDPAVSDWYKNAAFERGLDNETASGLYNDYLQMEAEKVAQEDQLKQIQADNDFKQLKQDFGPAFDERVTLANRALTEFGGDEAVQKLAEAGLSNNPTVVKMLANAGMMLAEGKFTEGSSTGKFGMTSEEATQKINQLRSDPEFMKHYANPASSKHKSAAGQLEDLYKIKVNSAG